MSSPVRNALSDLLSQVAPGTALRDGIDRILSAHMGALIVLGDGPDVLRICTGGFHLDAAMTPQRLSEVAKMDGAIVLDASCSRIAWANVHLVPDPAVATAETGTRHRTAERVARSIGAFVVAVSEEMGTITLYSPEEHRRLEPADSIAMRANNLIQVLVRFKSHFDEVFAVLGSPDFAGILTAREVAVVLQQAELVLRVEAVLAELIGALGDRGQLVRLQRDELVAGVAEQRREVVARYLEMGEETEDALLRLAALDPNELSSLQRVLEAAGGAIRPVDLEQPVVLGIKEEIFNRLP